MKFFRVEHSTEKGINGFKMGPYVGRPDNGEFFLEFEPTIHPLPHEDELLQSNGPVMQSHSFAFESKSHLYAWFKYDFENLSRLGYVVSVYETDDYIIGEKQCCIRNATLVDTLSFKEFIYTFHNSSNFLQEI